MVNFTNGTKLRKVSHQGVLKIVGAEKSWTAFKKNPNYKYQSDKNGQSEKIKLNYYFQTSLWCLKRFYEVIKPLEAPQRSVKIKI